MTGGQAPGGESASAWHDRPLPTARSVELTELSSLQAFLVLINCLARSMFSNALNYHV